jgi:hypothetical protein
MVSFFADVDAMNSIYDPECRKINVDEINVDVIKIGNDRPLPQTRAMPRDLTEFTVDDMAGFFRHFVSEVSSSPLYAALCPLLAENPLALSMYAEAPGTQRRPNLLLAALHYSVLRDQSHSLASWFKTVGGNRIPSDPELESALASFVAERFDELKTLVTNGATQTNEVGRSALVLPALATLAAEQNKPVAIVEIGTSAGLNLRPDAYAVTYTNADGTTTTVGPQDATVQIATDSSQSKNPLPFEDMKALQIGVRTGVDLHPLDVTDEFQARWLCALIWPDDTTRFRRLRAAVDYAIKNPIAIVQGDAVETVGAHIASVPTEQHPVVVTTWVLTYLTEPQRRAFNQALEQAAQTRDFAWIAMEHPAYANGLPWPEAITETWGAQPLDPAGQTIVISGTPLVVHRYENGVRTSQWIATVHAHGHWINWHPVLI